MAVIEYEADGTPVPFTEESVELGSTPVHRRRGGSRFAADRHQPVPA